MQPTIKYMRLVRWSPYSSFSISKRLCHDSSDKSDGKKEEEKELQNKTKKDEVKHKMNKLLQSINKMKFSTEEKVKVSSLRDLKLEKKLKVQVVRKTSKKKEIESDIIDFSLRKATKDVSEYLGGDAKETESELLNSLQSHSTAKGNLSDLLSGMKITKQKPRPDDSDAFETTPSSRLSKFRNVRGDGSNQFMRVHTPIDLFGAPPLNIFTSNEAREAFKEVETRDSFLPIWDACLDREKKAVMACAPKNYYEEVIKWTEEGKLWTFPIDNEIGLEEEKSYTFADHIFLEKYLEGWCPSKGPISHFMELVCVGLSKNPYLTVTRKKAHIEWYKNYFESKQDVLRDVGAI